MKKIFIIDVVNYLFRSYYAIGPMTNEKGESTSALFGFIRSIKKLIKDFEIDYIICTFDGPDNKKSRQALYADYKMHRKGAPEDLFPQFALTNEFCKYFGLSTICVEGVEADDTMATIAKYAKKNHLETYLCTSDKDLFQLVDDNTFIILPHKNNLLVDEKKVHEIYKIAPKQMLDYLAIVGDTSDNIPGVPGFGPKTAQMLLQEFGSLDEILKNIDKVPGKKKQEILRTNQDKALLSKELATLNTNVKIPDNLDFYKKKDVDIENLKEFYKKMNFNKFLQELNVENEKHEKNIKKDPFKKDLFEDEIFQHPPSEKINIPNNDLDYKLISNEKELKNLIDLLINQKEICVDTETSSEDPIKAEIIGIGLGIKAKQGWYIPFNGNIEKDIILDNLRKLFLNDEISFFGHNIKYDLKVLDKYDLKIKKISFDTILASYLLHPEKRRHNLDALTLEYFEKVKISYKELVTDGKKTFPLEEIEINKVKDYCLEDVDYTIRLKNIFEKRLFQENLNDLFYNIEIPLIFILAKMEIHGIFLDEKSLEIIKVDLENQLESLEKEIYLKAGIEFNINSPKQLSDVLYNKLKLTPPKRQKTQFSTGIDVLERLKKESDIVKLLIEYRTLNKLLTTYANALPKQINKTTNRIHPTYNQSITATGRLSCQNPNLQNIPIRSSIGKKIREAFKPEKDSWSYVGADYSQIELRLLAHLSQDPTLLKAFQNNEDIHAYTASLIFKVPLENVDKEMRSIAKAVNFGTLYGQGAYGLSRLIDIPYKEADKFIKSYFEKYEKVKEYLNSSVEFAKKNKYAITIFKRKRPLPDIDNKNPMIIASAKRLAINTPLQGSAADIIKKAMIEIDEEIKKAKLNSFLILQIHDELIYETPDDEIVKMKEILKAKMENVTKLTVPLTIDIQVGKNWSKC